MSRREEWASASDPDMLARCEIDLYRASGPGGQKRNKTSSAVRLRHLPSGLRVIAEESRSQHENKARALRRLRLALWIEVREPTTPGPLTDHPSVLQARSPEGSLWLRPKDPRYLPLAALLLDALEESGARVADTAARFDISTAALTEILKADEHVWKEAGTIRKVHGQKPLQ